MDENVLNVAEQIGWTYTTNLISINGQNTYTWLIWKYYVDTITMKHTTRSQLVADQNRALRSTNPAFAQEVAFRIIKAGIADDLLPDLANHVYYLTEGIYEKDTAGRLALIRNSK
jgi:hypothetical protein